MLEAKNKYLKDFSTTNIISATTGILKIAKIPVVDSPDWILPQSLILTIDEYSERIWSYLWQPTEQQGSQDEESDSHTPKKPQQQTQNIAVYHLLPQSITPEKIVVVESVTDVHRIALQIHGEVTFHTVRLTDLRDATPEDLQNHDFVLPAVEAMDTIEAGTEVETDTPLEGDNNTSNLTPSVALAQDFIYQPVMFQGELCVVPELDKLSHYLVDLDSEA